MRIGDSIIVLATGHIGVIDDITLDGKLVCKFQITNGYKVRILDPFDVEEVYPGYK